MSNEKGRSGRKPAATDITNYLYNQIDKNWPELINKLIQRAIEGDKECLQYCLDRRIGKPVAKQETILKGHILLTPDELEKESRILECDRAAETKLLE